jgi:hypothetical protein
MGHGESDKMIGDEYQDGGCLDIYVTRVEEIKVKLHVLLALVFELGGSICWEVVVEKLLDVALPIINCEVYTRNYY